MTKQHRIQIQTLVARGWTAGPWKKAVIEALRRPQWLVSGCAEEIIEVIESCPRIFPDAWRTAEVDGKLLIQFIEVEVESMVRAEKIAWYDALFWACDFSEEIVFECVRMDRFGQMTTLVGEGVALQRLAQEIGA